MGELVREEPPQRQGNGRFDVWPELKIQSEAVQRWAEIEDSANVRMKTKLLLEVGRDLHEHFKGAAVRVRALLRERVERVAEPGLPDKLECRPSHPAHQVDFPRSTLHSSLECRTKLLPFRHQSTGHVMRTTCGVTLCVTS